MRKPACYNQPRPSDGSGYWIKVRRYHSFGGKYDMVDQFIPFVLSRECMNDHRHPHPECDGCEHRKS